jgi:hypothetical protein
MRTWTCDDQPKLEQLINKTNNVLMLDKPFDAELFVAQLATVKQNPKPHHKPRGFWYACGAEWIDWVCTEGGPNFWGPHIYTLKINKRRFVKLTTVAAIDTFTRKYGAGDYIHWDRVAQDFTGIEICPYQQSRRHSLLWYYTWDVASGCFWDPHVLLGVDEV